jgi:transcriptional regulator with XRE-family HTH domain
MRIDVWHRELLQRSPAYARAVAELEEDESSRIADEVLALRMEAGLTQTELAKLAKTTQAEVSRLECAEGNPKLATIERVLRALRRSIALEWGGVVAQMLSAPPDAWVAVAASSTIGSAAGFVVMATDVNWLDQDAAQWNVKKSADLEGPA